MTTKQTDAIKTFLQVNAKPHLTALYHAGMEVQVNAAQDSGERITEEYGGRSYPAFYDSKTHETWKSFRIPHNSGTEPEYDPNKAMRWDLSQHCECIGLSGWNFADKISEWVAFDFDHIVGHNTGLTDEELSEILEQLKEVPWVGIRYSTGGKGYHVTVSIAESPEVVNHTEHKAIGFAVLAQLSALTGVDFRAQVDVAGSNTWIWHRRAVGGRGFDVVKEAEEALQQIPPNWRDYRRKPGAPKRRKNLPGYIPNDSQDKFENACAQNPRVPIDDEHKRIFKFLESIRAQWWWDQDRHLMVCHTADLKRAHTELGLKGLFETNSTGKHAGSDHNCFCFPLPNGAWSVRRFETQDEHAYWERVGDYVHCLFNSEPTLGYVARVFGAQTKFNRDIAANTYTFFSVDDAKNALKILGVDLQWYWTNRAVRVEPHRNGIVVHVKAVAKEDDNEYPSWVRTHGWWTQRVEAEIETEETSTEIDTCESVRHVYEDQEGGGWYVYNHGSGYWIGEGLKHTELYLAGHGFDAASTKRIMAQQIHHPWKLVAVPFASEYPGKRIWNLHGAKIKYEPNITVDPYCPTWLKVLEHCGRGLNSAIEQNAWCREHNITTGQEYLRLWIAYMFQKPFKRLPMLFFYSRPQNTGKSTFFEALQLLMDRNGYVDVADALTGNFNGQMQGSVLCYIDEYNLGRDHRARERIKYWLTAEEIPIHPKGMTPFMVPNTTHFVHTANDIDYCAVWPGDLRIVLIEVQPFAENEIMDKEVLFGRLTAEAPDFLGDILTATLPPPAGRMQLPVIETVHKTFAQNSKMSAVETFLINHTFECDGALTKWEDLRSALIEHMNKLGDTQDIIKRTNWQYIRRLLAATNIPMANVDGVLCIGNLSLKKTEKSKDFRWVLENQELRKAKQ